MTTFESEVELSITIPERELRQARRQIQEGIGETPVGMTDGGTPSAQAAGGAGGRQARRARREFRWARERTNTLDDILELLEGWDGDLDGDGAGSGLLGGLLGDVGGGVAGALPGAIASGIGAAAGSAAGTAIGDAVSGADPIEVADPSPLEVDDPSPFEVDTPAEIAVADPSPLEVDDPDAVPVDTPGPLDVDDPSPLEVADPGTIPVDAPDSIPVDAPEEIPLSVDVGIDGTITTETATHAPTPSSQATDTPQGDIVGRGVDRTIDAIPDVPGAGLVEGTIMFGEQHAIGEETIFGERMGPVERREARDAPANGTRPSRTDGQTTIDQDVDVTVDVAVDSLDDLERSINREFESTINGVRRDLERAIEDLERQISG